MLYITELIQEIHKRETTLEYFINIDFLLQVVAVIIIQKEKLKIKNFICSSYNQMVVFITSTKTNP